MSQKNVAAVLLAVATVLGGPPAVQRVWNLQEQPVETIEITGQSEAVLGELVELKVNGSRPAWWVPVRDHRVSGDTLLVSFRRPGEFEIIASSIGNGRPSIARHVITVTGHQPDVEVVPDTVTVPLTQIVEQWCIESNAPEATCKQIGENFIRAAADASDIDGLLSRLSKANRQVNQAGCERVLARIQQYLFDNLVGKDFVTHQRAFTEIGTGLTNYANTEQNTITLWE